MVALKDERGEPLRSKAVPVADRKAARERSLAGLPSPANEATVSVLEVGDAYLAKAKDAGGAKTYNDRADTLFDFCQGYRRYCKKLWMESFQAAACSCLIPSMNAVP
jgi:hypothetical protein